MPFTRRAGPASQAAVRRLGEEGVPPTEMVPGKVWKGFTMHLELCKLLLSKAVTFMP